MFLEVAGGVFVGGFLALILFQIVKEYPQIIAWVLLIGIISFAIFLFFEFPTFFLCFLAFDVSLFLIVELWKGITKWLSGQRKN